MACLSAFGPEVGMGMLLPRRGAGIDTWDGFSSDADVSGCPRSLIPMFGRSFISGNEYCLEVTEYGIVVHHQRMHIPQGMHHGIASA